MPMQSRALAAGGFSGVAKTTTTELAEKNDDLAPDPIEARGTDGTGPPLVYLI